MKMSDSSQNNWKVRAGTRGSALALWQTRYVLGGLAEKHSGIQYEEVIVKTAGDKDRTTPLKELGGQGLFIKEIEKALLSGEIDFAVHSLKDMPVVDSGGLVTAAVPPREIWNDIFISKDYENLECMPPSSTLGTGSPRRKVQINWAYPEPEVVSIRGNVGTRIRKVRQGEVDGIIIANAGVKRLGEEKLLSGLHVEVLKSDVMLPAPGQGAIAVQCREDDSKMLTLLKSIHCDESWQLVHCEREFLRCIGGGCHTPVAALARVKNGTLLLEAAVAPDEDSFLIRLSAEQEKGESPGDVGRRLAQEARLWVGEDLE